MSRQVDMGINHRQSDLTRDWIWAIVVSSAVGFVMGAIAYAVRQVFDLTGPDTGLFATFMLFATEIVTAVPSFAVYANRTGAILRRKLPAFPVLTWYALHVLLGVALGAIVAYVERATEPAPHDPPTLSDVLGIGFGGLLAGAVLGAVLGALQGLVLRKAARTVGRWIAFSTLGGTAFALFALTLYIPGDHSLASEILTLAVGFVIAVMAGLALLPALHKLEPR